MKTFYWWISLGFIIGFSLLVIFGLLLLKCDPVLSGFFGGIVFCIACKIDYELSKPK
jgi:hypothetical protein